jgi:hypothetical protein
LNTGIYSKNLKETNHLEDLGVDCRLVPKCVKNCVKKYGLFSFGSLQEPEVDSENTVMTVRFSLKGKCYWLIERASVSQEWLCSLKTVVFLFQKFASSYHVGIAHDT